MLEKKIEYCIGCLKETELGLSEFSGVIGQSPDKLVFVCRNGHENVYRGIVSSKQQEMIYLKNQDSQSL